MFEPMPHTLSDPNELKIYKAKSVNQKYMTEMVGNQKMNSDERNDFADQVAKNVMASELMSSEGDGANSRRILSEMGTVPIIQNQQALIQMHMA